MLRRTEALLKKGWTHTPGRTRRGGKNLAWRPKISERVLTSFVPLHMEHPPRRPNNWHAAEFNALGYSQWPKEVGFYNAGDNFEITPEMHWRLFEKNHQEEFWTPKHNEDTVIHLMPKVEQSPAEYLLKVNNVLEKHIARFGADHLIYNAVMQAYAFGKEYTKCITLFEEMKKAGLEPNGQTYVNLMLAAKLAGHPKAKAEEHFKEGVRTQSLQAVMRLDTEFQMWWDQLERMGSFTAPTGHLSVKEEGATPMPANMWAIWGWDRTERKYVSRAQDIQKRVAEQGASFKWNTGSVYQRVKRQPWAKYRGLLPQDYRGPGKSQTLVQFEDRPKAEFNDQTCNNAF